MSRRSSGALVLALLGIAGCRAEPRDGIDQQLITEREERLARLAHADTIAVDQPIARWVLPAPLAEISGLALDSAGRLFGHDDERGRVFEISYRGGALIKEFRIAPVADFEGLAIVGREFFMVTSNGKVYQFQEAAHNAVAPVTVHDLQLGRECEFEGIAWEPRDSSLLLPCKNVGGARETGLRIYRWWPHREGRAALSGITVPTAQLQAENGWTEFEPTDMTRDPATGNFLLLLGRQRGLVEITSAGAVVNSTALPGDFPQAEGIAVTGDGLLIIASEGVNGPAVIAVYRRAVGPRPPAGR